MCRLLGVVSTAPIAVEDAVGANVLKDFVEANHWLHYGGPALGAALVIGLGKLMQARAARQPAA